MAKTVEQIANDLHLSITSVRLVLNGKAEQYRISAKTQQRITHYVTEHGYTVNYTARSLKLNKTDTLGLIIPPPFQPVFLHAGGETGDPLPGRRLSADDQLYLQRCKV